MTKRNIPILLLTGYLGSGKTTLVNRLLRNNQGVRYAVIVNDIGEVNIDASLISYEGVVSQKDDSLVPLQNGCICCTLKMDLVEQLRDICSARDEAGMPKFDYIVIEASGICEPLPIAQTITSYAKFVPPDNNPIPVLDCIVAVVDALRMHDEFERGDKLVHYKTLGDKAPEEDIESLLIQQIEFCNLIIVNKIDELAQEDQNHLKSIIRTLQPNAKMIECNYCDFAIDQLLNTKTFSIEKVLTSPAWMEYLEKDEGELHNEESGEQLEYGISTFVYYVRPPFDMNRFDDFVSHHWPKEVIRCKGLCYFDSEYDMCYVFEQSGHQVSIKPCGTFYATLPPVDLQDKLENDPSLLKDWDDQYGDRMQKLVFIGQNMPIDEIKSRLDACLSSVSYNL